MTRRQMAALCVCNVAIYAGIGGLVGLMPLYLERFGAGAGRSGLFLAVAYSCLAISNVAGGRLCGLLGRPRTLLVMGGALAAPLAWATGRAPTFGAAMALMGCLWFVTGIAMTMASIATGQSAENGRQGRRFGVLTLSGSVGLLLGSFVSGPIVDRWGYPGLFAAFAVLYMLVPLAGLTLDDSASPVPSSATAAGFGLAGGLGFVVLVVASVLAQGSNILLFLSRTLIMGGRGYDATAISTAAAVGSLATLPLPFALGWLADRVSRKPLILACLAAPAAGLMVQLGAAEPWQFWVASALSTVVGASVVVAAAVVTDALPADAVAAPLGLLNATPWIGIVLGLTLGGAAIDALGMELALRLGVVPAGVAVVLLLLVALPGQVARRQRWPATTDSRAAATRTANVGAKGARV